MDKPRYITLADALLLEAHMSGERTFRLPSELKLMKQYGLSITTVRKALQHLVRKNLLVKQHGIGSFIRTEMIRARTVRVSLARHYPADRRFHEEIIRRFQMNNDGVTVTWPDRMPYTVENLSSTDIIQLSMDYAKRNAAYFMPLDTFIQTNCPDVYPQKVLDLFRVQGTCFGLPRKYSPFYLFCDLKRFKEKGIPIPSADWTWDEFLAAVERLYEPERAYGYFADPNFYDLFPLILQNEGSISETSLFDPHDSRTMQAFSFYAKLCSMSDIDHANITWRTGFERLMSGRAAIVFSTLTFLLNFPDEQLPDGYGILPLPRGRRKANILTGECYCLTKYAGRLEDASALLAELSGEYARALLFRERILMPVTGKNVFFPGVPDVQKEVACSSVISLWTDREIAHCALPALRAIFHASEGDLEEACIRLKDDIDMIVHKRNEIESHVLIQ
ncbi:MAG: extracellular solute-binding protein [Spirochaetota bacterium]